MLAFVPLIWFALLLVYFLVRRGVCISAYVALMYVITSLCAVLMYVDNLVEVDRVNNSLLSTIVYCFLISISIIPIYKFEKYPINDVYIRKSGFVKGLIWFYTFCFFFLLVFYWRDMMFRITLADWDEIKTSATMGNGYSIRQLGGVLRPISIVVRIFTSISFVMIPVFFLTFKSIKLPKLYSYLAILGSISSFLVAILDADRSRIFIWVIIMGLCLVIFWPNLHKRVKKSIIPIVLLVLCGAFIYVYNVSISRFSDSDEGVFSSIIVYAGQSYSNFCYFFDNFNNAEGINTRVLLPFTHTFIIGDYLGGVDLQQSMTLKTGIYCGVFYSFLGLFIIDSNRIGPFIFVLVYLMLWASMKKRKGTSISFINFLKSFFLIIVPTYGCIAYMYSHWYLTSAIVILISICGFSERAK